VLADGAKHGHAVIDALKRRSGDALDLPEGTVYPVLHRLERDGLLESTWSVVGGRRRRTYSLTTGGQEALADRRREWESVSSAVGRVAGGAPWPATS
jgi:DNA-binding PadR family transcriptional regulator